jgi:hypothetical protein
MRLMLDKVKRTLPWTALGVALALNLAAMGMAVAQMVPQGPAAAAPAASGKTCSQWNSECVALCKGDNCRLKFCGKKLTDCKASGCWIEGGAQVSQKHCGVTKS